MQRFLYINMYSLRDVMICIFQQEHKRMTANDLEKRSRNHLLHLLGLLICWRSTYKKLEHFGLLGRLISFVKKQKCVTTNRITGSDLHKWLQGSHRRYSVPSTGPARKDYFMLTCVMYCMLTNAVTIK